MLVPSQTRYRLSSLSSPSCNRVVRSKSGRFRSNASDAAKWESREPFPAGIVVESRDQEVLIESESSAL